MSEKCIICGKKIKNEYFNGVRGKICVDCLKSMMIYHGLKTMGLIEKTFTQEECGEMFRMGTLHGEKIERSKYETLYLPEHELKRCFVTINGAKYKICQYFNYEENKKEVERCAKGIPDVIVHYVITEV